MVDVNQLEDIKVEKKPRRPRTRGLTTQKDQERESSPPLGQLTFDELITAKIEKDKELWLDRVNVHLEKLLKKQKRIITS